MVAPLQQCHNNPKKIFLRRLVFSVLFCHSDGSPRGGIAEGDYEGGGAAGLWLHTKSNKKPLGCIGPASFRIGIPWLALNSSAHGWRGIWVAEHCTWATGNECRGTRHEPTTVSALSDGHRRTNVERSSPQCTMLSRFWGR